MATKSLIRANGDRLNSFSSSCSSRVGHSTLGKVTLPSYGAPATARVAFLGYFSVPLNSLRKSVMHSEREA